MPMSGRAKSGFSTARAAPSTAPAAWLSAALQIELSPYRPPAQRIIWISAASRSGGNIAEKLTVETTYLGTPSGSAWHRSSARSVPIEPPSTTTPSKRPSP